MFQVYDEATAAHFMFGGNPGGKEGKEGRVRLGDFWRLVLVRLGRPRRHWSSAAGSPSTRDGSPSWRGAARWTPSADMYILVGGPHMATGVWADMIKD